MKVVPFISDTLPKALANIHERLGPDAVVLSVRPLPRQGIARLWPNKRQPVEVLACLAEPGEEPQGSDFDLSGGNSEHPLAFALAGELPPALHDGTGRPHVFIGPPGVGKTTLLCKWVTRSVLQENRAVRVWRLDGATANTAEFLNVYTEMLRVPVERFWRPLGFAQALRDEEGYRHEAFAPDDLLLIDVPGVPPADPQALRSLQTVLAGLPNPRVHLVLNAAYDTEILREQVRAFSCFTPEDLSFCHLDEERRQDKLRELLTGTNCRLRFMSKGQKVPGEFAVAAEAPALCGDLAC